MYSKGCKRNGFCLNILATELSIFLGFCDVGKAITSDDLGCVQDRLGWITVVNTMNLISLCKFVVLMITLKYFLFSFIIIV